MIRLLLSLPYYGEHPALAAPIMGVAAFERDQQYDTLRVHGAT